MSYMFLDTLFDDADFGGSAGSCRFASAINLGDDVILFSETNYEGITKTKANPFSGNNWFNLVGAKLTPIQSIYIPDGLQVQLSGKKRFSGNYQVTLDKSYDDISKLGLGYDLVNLQKVESLQW